MLSSGLVQSLGDWVNEYHWDAFWTLTFEQNYGEQTVIRRVSRWADKHTISEPGTMSWLFFLEMSGFGELHAHGLTRHESFSRRLMWDRWFKKNGRARSLKYDPELGANYYIAKYLTKQQLSWIIDGRGVGQGG
ncbi:hypothetical protein ES703_125867 [subsurface metagenome]